MLSLRVYTDQPIAALSSDLVFLFANSSARHRPAGFRPLLSSINDAQAWLFLPQFVKLTSNACAPREEARPSVSPARYMVTPFWLVSFACIFPSIRVSPRAIPW